jgi:integrase/recombinase XerD
MTDNIFMDTIENYLIAQTRNTARSYRFVLERLEAWIQQTETEPEALNPDLVGKFLDEQEGWGANTRRLAICALRAFYRWWQGASHPVLQTKLRRVKAPPQRALTPGQALRLLSAINARTRAGIRDLALVTLMLDTGLREMEICRLELKRLSLEDRRLLVLCKGDVWGRASFSPVTRAHLEDWMKLREYYLRRFRRLPPTVFFSLTRGRALQESAVRDIFERLSARCGFVVSPHDLRRTFATLSTVVNHAPTRIVMAAGRWRNLATFEKYLETITDPDFDDFYPVQSLAK